MQIRAQLFALRAFACFLLALGWLGSAGTAHAQTIICTTPTNYATNGSFASGLTTGYASTGSWLYNQTLDSATYGTFYASRAAVQNPAAAPTGNLATNYPAASLNSFVINENDAAADSLTVTTQTSGFAPYEQGQLLLWFDMGWRQAGGTTNYASTLRVKVNGTTYFSIVTVAGNATGNATGTTSNGATLRSGTGTDYAVTGGAGALSQWNTIGLNIPYSSSSLPTISFEMSGGAGVSDDFAIDRIYVPVCPVAQPTVVKTSSLVSDGTNGTTNPKGIPGATIRYCIVVTNPSGNPTLSSYSVTDNISSLPLSYVAGSLRTNGTVASSACNDDGSAGGTFNSGTVTATVTAIPANSSRTVYFDAIIN